MNLQAELVLLIRDLRSRPRAKITLHMTTSQLCQAARDVERLSVAQEFENLLLRSKAERK